VFYGSFNTSTGHDNHALGAHNIMAGANSTTSYTQAWPIYSADDSRPDTVVEKRVTVTPSGADETVTDVLLQCVICLNNKRRLAPVECGHLSLCFACAHKLISCLSTDAVRCPICQTVITHAMHNIYI
jgi:hypothetical protein